MLAHYKSKSVVNLENVLKGFAQTYPDYGAMPLVYFAPGRVCLVGEHIDYNGGFVLPAALSMGIYLAVGFVDKNTVSLSSAGRGEIFTQALDTPITPLVQGSWQNYPLGILQSFQAEGLKLPGIYLYYYADLPAGAGLSSSAAIETVTALVLQEYFGLEIDKIQIAQRCKTIENNFVGVQCGIMDQFSSIAGKRDHAILLDCNTLANYRYVPFDLVDYTLIVMHTNKARALAESKFNERFAECQAALEFFPQYQYLAQAALPELSIIENETLRARTYHVVTEHQRVQDAATALQKQDWLTLGEIFNASHCSLRDHYAVTGNELDALVEAAWASPHCIGARMTGAGFGGCAIALINKGEENDFTQSVAKHYQAATGLIPSFFQVFAADGAQKLC